MKKRNLLALGALLIVLLTGCGRQQTAGTISPETLFEKATASMEEGHFFFAGKILSIRTEAKAISYYETASDKNTFYSVEITEDFFGCMPDGSVTVCVLGTSENFLQRRAPEKGKEYLFDVSLWVQEQQAVFLLSTFYTALPERINGQIFFPDSAGNAALAGTGAAYRTRLLALAEEQDYCAETVLHAAQERLKSAAERDPAYFVQKSIPVSDRAALERTNRTAAELLQKAESTATTWGGIQSLLQAS